MMLHLYKYDETGFLHAYNQGCWWNERSLNQGLDRCRDLGLGVPFFSDSDSDSDEALRISHKLGLGLAAKLSKVIAIQRDHFRGQYTPRPSAHPGFPGHVFHIWWERGHPPPHPPPLFPPAPTPPPPPSTYLPPSSPHPLPPPTPTPVNRLTEYIVICI